MIGTLCIALASGVVIVGFPYDGETRMLAMRQRVHGVSCYIVSRSPWTQRGVRRVLPPVPSRIGRVPVVVVNVLQNHHTPKDPWGHEVAVRDALLQGLVGCNASDHDVFVVSDADEVLSTASLSWLHAHVKPRTTYSCQLEWNLYSRCWGGRLLRRIPFASTVAHARQLGPNAMRSSAHSMHMPQPCGYHCSWCFGHEAFRNKIRHIHEADGTDYVTYGRQQWSNQRIDNLRKHGLWLDGSKHGKWVCPTHREML